MEFFLGQSKVNLQASQTSMDKIAPALKVMRRANLVAWPTLLVGLANGWCTKYALIEHAEECLDKYSDEIDVDLVSIVAGASLPESELVDLALHYLDVHGMALSPEHKQDAKEKWRFAHLSALLEETASDEEKIDRLQELYSEFGFPDDMASCSIYNADQIDPLQAAKNVLQELSKKLKD